MNQPTFEIRDRVQLVVDAPGLRAGMIGTVIGYWGGAYRTCLVNWGGGVVGPVSMGKLRRARDREVKP